ncbi:MAG: hypothetical protein GX494_01675 [Clostridiaceae bacterium]|nr:hypothetical protein [Clostridiaceae bacterium]
MNAKKYIREIIQRSCLPSGERKRLKSDLENEIASRLERGETIEQIIERMGDPDTVAAELYENFTGAAERPFFEYKSEKTLFGLPLVHIIRTNYAVPVPYVRTTGARGINIGGRYGRVRYSYGLPAARGVFAFGPKAKGIIAVGNFSTGFISIGNISAGIFSIGNISAGLLSLGNIALAPLVALGNFAAAALSAANMALGYAAAGNLASGKYAIGNEANGTFTFSVSNLYTQFEAIKAFISELEAPAVVKAFFGLIEKVCEIVIDPISTLPFHIAISCLLLAVILALYIVPNRLLTRKNRV